MSLAEQMLDTMSVSEDSESSLVDEEPHIVIDESRIAIVPAELKTIAVTGDKDIETVTFDCVRYWDGNDLSTFAIYLNYVLPDMRTGTYIPKEVVTSEGDPFYHFDWEIKDSITQKSGKISFAITAIKTRKEQNGAIFVDKQWSSIPNSDCSIALGLNISNVPSEEESEDILSQMSAILEDLQSNLTELVYSNVVQSSGYDTTKVMSQAASSNTFSNAIKGNVSGAVVAMDDVSPVDHKVPVKLRSKNLIPYPYHETTKTQSGVTFADNGDGSITINGTATGSARFAFLQSRNIGNPKGGTYTFSGIVGGSKCYLQCFSDNEVHDSVSNGSVTFDTSGYITTAALFVSEGAIFNNFVVKPQIEIGTVATDYTPYVAENTNFSVNSNTSNLLRMINGTHKLTTYYTATLNDGHLRVDRTAGSVPAEASSNIMRPYISFVLPAGRYFFRVENLKKVNIDVAVLYIETEEREYERRLENGFVDFTLNKPSNVRIGVYMYDDVNFSWNGYIDADFMLSMDEEKPFEPCGIGETITANIAKGVDFLSIAPNMTIFTVNDGVIVEAEYNKDVNKIQKKRDSEMASVDERLYDLDDRVTALEANICFQEGTKILMADGTSKNIEDVEYGDMIMTWDIENQRTMPCKSFGKVYTGITPSWEHLCFDNGAILKIYQNHRIFNADKGYLVHSREWLIGQKAIASDGTTTTYCYHPKKVPAAIASHKYTIFCETGMFFANGILCGHHISQPLDIYNRTHKRIPLSEEEIADMQAYADARDSYYVVEVQNLDYLRESLPFRKAQDIANRKIEIYKKKLADRDYKTIKAMQGKLSDDEIAENIATCEELRSKVNQEELIAKENENMILNLQEKYGVHPKLLQEIESINVLKAVAKAREKNLKGR